MNTFSAFDSSDEEDDDYTRASRAMLKKKMTREEKKAIDTSEWMTAQSRYNDRAQRQSFNPLDDHNITYKGEMGYIFHCTPQTKVECLAKMLFGTSKAMGNTYQDIKPGTILYLYDLHNKDITGPFLADSTMGEWNKHAWKGRFPKQVEVKSLWPGFAPVTKQMQSREVMEITSSIIRLNPRDQTALTELFCGVTGPNKTKFKGTVNFNQGSKPSSSPSRSPFGSNPYERVGSKAPSFSAPSFPADRHPAPAPPPAPAPSFDITPLSAPVRVNSFSPPSFSAPSFSRDQPQSPPGPQFALNPSSPPMLAQSPPQQPKLNPPLQELGLGLLQRLQQGVQRGLGLSAPPGLQDQAGPPGIQDEVQDPPPGFQEHQYDGHSAPPSFQLDEIVPQSDGYSTDPKPPGLSDLMSMGFPEDKCYAALSAAKGSQEIAIEYLLSGIIPDAPAPQEEPSQLEQNLAEMRERLNIVPRETPRSPPKSPQQHPSAQVYEPSPSLGSPQQSSQGGAVPPEGYLCKKCKVPGHYFNDCPLFKHYSAATNQYSQVCPPAPPLGSPQQSSQGGAAPPPGYVCKKCKVPGHFFSDCPLYDSNSTSQTSQSQAKRPPPPGYVCRKCKGTKVREVGPHFFDECPLFIKDPNAGAKLPPPNYICNKCGVPGHFRNDCPLDKQPVSGDGGSPRCNQNQFPKAGESTLYSHSSTANYIQNKATKEFTIMSHEHGRDRRDGRHISKIDLQQAIKYGVKSRANTDEDGNTRYKFIYEGICYITDRTCKQEITSYPIPRDLTAKEFREHNSNLAAIKNKSFWTSHTVLVVDMSWSMSQEDVDGKNGFSRAKCVFISLAMDFVRNRLLREEAIGTDVVSIILMRAEGTVVIRHKPTDWNLFNDILRLMNTEEAIGHGHYLPAIEAAKELLDYNQVASCALGFFFLSDGKPSDPTPKGTEGTKQGVAEANRRRIGNRFGQLASEYGRRMSVCTAAFGQSDEDYSVLEVMAHVANLYGCKAIFKEPNKNEEFLKDAMISLTTSITATQTELTEVGAGRRAIRHTIRKSRNEALSDVKEDESEWDIFYKHKGHILRMYVYNSVNDDFDELDLPDGVEGLAFHKKTFGEGAERIVKEFAELDKNGERKGDRLVYKQSRFLEDTEDEDEINERFENLERRKNYRKKRMTNFHSVFCKTQNRAAEIADKFRMLLDSLPNAQMRSVPRIEFLNCWLYSHALPGQEMTAGLIEKHLSGQYKKWNNNAGAIINALGAIVEGDSEEEEEEDEDNDHEIEDLSRLTPSEVCQTFSHFSYVYSQHKELVCDLQGVYEEAFNPPLLKLTDPVIHRRTKATSGSSSGYGRTDGGMKGIRKFFDTHKCGPLCRTLNLHKEHPNNMVQDEPLGWEGLLGLVRSEEQKFHDREKKRKEKAEKKEKRLAEKRELELAAKKHETMSAFCAACSLGNLEKAKALCAAAKSGTYFDPDFAREEDEGYTPLLYAAQEGYVNTVKWLVKDARADPNVVDWDGNSAVYVATDQNKRDVIEYLVKDTKANVDLVTIDGYSPLHNATMKGNLEIVKILCEDGKANSELRDSRNMTPYEIARSKNYKDIVDYFHPPLSGRVPVKEGHFKGGRKKNVRKMQGGNHF